MVPFLSDGSDGSRRLGSEMEKMGGLKRPVVSWEGGTARKRTEWKREARSGPTKEIHSSPLKWPATIDVPTHCAQFSIGPAA